MTFLANLFHRLAVLAAPIGLLGLAALPAQAQTTADAALIQRGEYLAIAGDCVACHTAPGGRSMAGGLKMASPLGTIVSTNITPSRTHGIGGYSFTQFDRAVRGGVRADGAQLYPAMPYTAYAKLTEDDTRALYAYFMHSVQPVDVAPEKTRLPFPFNIRLSMAGWNLLFLNKKPFAPDPERSAEWNRGAYLVEGPAHCGSCHTPRNILMAESSRNVLSGAALGGWFAPNITSDPVSGVGGWSVEELAGYLRTGHAAGKAQAAGPMAEAIDASLRHLDEADLRAIAVYLKSSPPVRRKGDTRPAFAWGQASDDLASIRGVALPANLDQMTGPQLYDAHCATCHQAQGQGSFDGGLPSLFHNAALGRSRPDNLVMVVLNGLHRQPDVNMPAFGRDLSDIQVATLVNYLTEQWGNPQSQVTAKQVATLRAGGPTSPLVFMVQASMLLVLVLIVAGLVGLWLRRKPLRRPGIGRESRSSRR
ncbi:MULTISPECIES: c-type cytochrome [unclassified Brevundimonas]|uniref:c-type cytochrome n=1 Tax=unclassified Brevundimonas TaxID=2622653 RepID=UPI003F936228